MARFKVFRLANGKKYPNGEYATKEDAEQRAAFVVATHGEGTKTEIVDEEQEPVDLKEDDEDDDK